MFITKKHLSRRTFLRAAGCDARFAILGLHGPRPCRSGQRSAPRLSFVYLPHGAIMDQWTPKKDGTNFELTPDPPAAQTIPGSDQHHHWPGACGGRHPAVHSLSPTTWLSGVRPKPTQGNDALAGVTADQIAAKQIGQETLLPSLELGTEDRVGHGGRLRSRIWLHLHELNVVELPHDASSDRNQSPAGCSIGCSARRAAPIRRTAASSMPSKIRSPICREKSDRKTEPLSAITSTAFAKSNAESKRRHRTEVARMPAGRPSGIPDSYEEHVKMMYDISCSRIAPM